MKRILSIVALLLPLYLLAQPRLYINKSTVNCGKVLFKTPVTAKFELRNRTLKQIYIEKVEASCGCTTIEYPQKSISAGQRFTISGTYDAQMLGHFNKQLAIYFRGAKKPVVLTMKGVVRSDLMDFSGSYPFAIGDLRVDRNDIEFDDVNRGDAPMAELQIMNIGNSQYKPVIMHIPAYLSAKAVPEIIEPNRTGKMILTLDSKKLHDYGLTQTMVYLSRFSGDKVGDENSINVSAVLLPDFRGMSTAQRQNAPVMKLSSTTIELGSFDGKSKKNGVIVITNTGKTDLNITALQMFTPGLEVNLNKRVLQAGESAKMKVTAVEKYLKAARSKPRVLMITNDPSTTKVIIDINVKE